MKIGVNLWIWHSPFGTDQLSLLSKARSAGAQIVEFALEDDAAIDARMLRNALANEGLECSTIGLFGPDRDFSSPDAAVRRRGVDHAARCIQTAAAVGSRVLSGAVAGVGGNEALSPEVKASRLSWAAEGLRRVGDFAAAAGVPFCVEILNRYETNLLNTAREASRLMAEVDHHSVGIHLDTFHMNMEETDMGEAIRQCGAKLFHLHGSDSHRGAPGDGHIRWEEIAAAVEDIRYDGAVVFECFNPAGRLAPLARFWQPAEESPDAIARRGITTLQKYFGGSRAGASPV